MADKDILQGWREIEEYLGLTRKTVNKRGFPIHNSGGGDTRQAVWAIRSELLEHAKKGRIVSK